jgi:integrase
VKTQQGYIFRKGPSWFLRYNDNVKQADGAIVRKPQLEWLAPYNDEFRNKAAVRPLAAKFLLPINAGSVDAQSTMKVADFVVTVYLPEVKESLRRSTYKNYNDIFTIHVEPRLGGITLRKFRCCDAENILADAARQAKNSGGQPLSHSSLERIKAFLSGVFKTAKRKGAFDGVNPVQDCKVPKGTPKKEMHAYSVEENQFFRRTFSGQTRTAIFLASHTGLRLGEMEGLLVRDYDPAALTLKIETSLWNGFRQEPKTEASKGTIPVSKQLAAELNRHLARLGDYARAGLPLFQSEVHTPLNLANVAKRTIIPTLEKMEGAPQWQGWHSFRRGLATILHADGVDDKTIQAVLRHSNVRVTMDCYVKTLPQSTINAVQRTGANMENDPSCNDHATPQAQLVN